MAQIDLARVRVAGSAEEVRELGMDPRRIFTCGPERPGVAACPIYDKCQQAQKDEHGFVTWTAADGAVVKPGTEGATRAGPGPLNLGVQMWKRQSEHRFKVVTRTCACWEYPQIRANWQAINGMGGDEPRAGCKVIAIEGERILLAGSKPEVQEDQRVIHVIQQGGISTVIKPFVRPRDNPAFAQSAMAMAELARESQKFQDSDLKSFVKLQTGGEPDVDLEITGAESRPAKGGASSRG